MDVGQLHMIDPSETSNLLEDKSDMMNLFNILNKDESNSNLPQNNPYLSNTYISQPTEVQSSQPSNLESVIEEKQRFINDSRESVKKFTTEAESFAKQNPRFSDVLFKMPINDQDNILKLMDRLDKWYIKKYIYSGTGEIKTIFVNNNLRNTQGAVSHVNEIKAGTVMYDKLDKLLIKMEENNN